MTAEYPAPQDIYDQLHLAGITLAVNAEGGLDLTPRDGQPIPEDLIGLARHWKPQLIALIRQLEAGLFFSRGPSG
jgi:hypothetical protein